ncbi:hypothetical protein EMIHUDRAFT_444260 [Emiliania huxleyi CCMP1516]|uniref:Uncharacterized protein n=2 Tax=Emiliania huxleyi TaxID=2903 RepID=A0A0D3JG70_EMIH1|nr:hypothetical protein EMIHUDRAFT_444260 [Emiliania huxleyi CCMP1516]EOD22505.1 hypothetical protein EMIHUDRAFT_444260 [Emiliania huxleyi CCMP1516]|eukprot:XP_005774934.1 hypothetical protein EMIHUDRAFT_444260 [Emiliania huxleyi CCMP1516]
MFSLLASLPPSAAAVAIGPHFVPSGSKRVWIGGRPAQPLRPEQRQSLLADLAEAVLAPSPFALVDIPKRSTPRSRPAKMAMADAADEDPLTAALGREAQRFADEMSRTVNVDHAALELATAAARDATITTFESDEAEDDRWASLFLARGAFSAEAACAAAEFRRTWISPQP